MKELTAFVVIFKRKSRLTRHIQEGWEDGVFVGRSERDEDGTLVDMDGKIVPPSDTFQCHDRPSGGCFHLRSQRE